MTVCIGLFCQQSGQLLQGGLAVNGTGGIVGRIHDDGLGMGTQVLRQRFKIDLETRQVRRHDDRLGTGIPDEYRILREEGREHQEFILRRGRQGPQGDGEGSRCTAGHVNVVGPKSRAVGLVQIIHDGLTGFLVALGGGIAVECGGGEFLQQLLQGIVYHCRCGHRGIAERKVINIFGTDHSSPLLAVFEKLTDGGTAAAETVHFFRNEHSGISFVFSAYYSTGEESKTRHPLGTRQPARWITHKNALAPAKAFYYLLERVLGKGEKQTLFT